MFDLDEKPQNFVSGMKVSLGPLGEPQSSIVRLGTFRNDGFSYHNLVNGLDGWTSLSTLRQIGVLVG